ncbi:hypothetical protein OSB04_025126 [Centaurea solstitialis]|uniref:Uncharacterized protein n=1 Tax=Centaurea solstitialis TaxID=347529 RepID=A0AA38WCS9_9ASTR|nr:hypothetical protein OSB04_025126 [Centaurea solstitialis]
MVDSGSQKNPTAAIDVNPECTFADRTMHTTYGCVFNGNWKRDIREGREESEVSLIKTLCSKITESDNADSWEWRLNESGIFSVASLRKAIDSMSLRRAGPSTSWNKLIPA